ncbi:hypothetical protein B484DRAFT_77506 [Ochromonadaceae sp. CCMP2298]|nr:hypothetical protein B484DRAFT_77506 [Ochromonadaceae sp. CCMP2298]
MLVSWLLSHHHEEPTAINGLKYLGKHMATGEGCFLMLRHGALEAVLKIHEFYQNQPPVQLLVIKVLRQLLDCNYTRTLVVSKAAVLSACFAIAHHHMNSPPHLEIAVHCIAQTARSEVCRREILRQNILPYMLNFCKRFSKSAKILRPALMLLLRVCTDQARLEHVCALHGVNTAIQCIRRHPSNALIVSPAILFLARAGQNHPPSMELLLQKNAAALVVEALKLVYSDAPIQLEGLKLLQIIAKTSQGWKQISAVHAGWQSICQGTNPGDALVHSLPGAFQNPGWAIGDTPFLPLLDRQKIAASKLGQSSLQTEPSAAWTPLSLREFMGLSVTGQVLSINTEQPRVFFELVSTLDMLPLSGEEREAWFQRVHAYEQESEVKIEDMVKTVQEMRRREALKKKMELKGLNVGAYSDEVLGTVKEVYVNGVRITSEYLQTRDADVEETLQGIA